MDFRAITKTVVVVIIATLSLSAVRAASVSYGQLEEARISLKQGDHKRAVLGYERCIQAYLPLLPSREQAIAEMQSMLRSLEKQQKPELALEGWRRLRAALLFSRSIFGQPDSLTLHEANLDIARLAAATDIQGKMSKEAIEQESMQLLAKHPKDISGFWGIMQFLFLLVWIGSTSYLVWNWQTQFIKQRIQFMAVSATAWLCWLGSLYMAG